MTGTPCHNGPMNAAEPQGVRASARAELLREVGLVARAHLAESGAAGLSVRAIARELGLASSALYRYYPSRDDLLTRLIVDSYNELGEAVEDHEATVDRSDLAGRYAAICHAVRDWARAHPHEYALIYGSPTILVDEQDVSGLAPGDCKENCRIYDGDSGGMSGVPPLERIVSALTKQGA